MDTFISKDGRRLRCGYTTGTCAAAAAKAAVLMLLTGKETSSVNIHMPKGISLELPVTEIKLQDNCASCAVRKDSGDDPDVTNGMLIFAFVTYSDSPGITIDGGTGIGRVTKPGLDQPVGAAAINSVPRKMIEDNIREVCRLFDVQHGFSVVISAPEGEKIAERTFNSRLGIFGGISIIGTTGIVEPMSDQALIDTIRVELKQRKAGKASQVILTPGNYGLDFICHVLNIEPTIPVMTSNFIGDALDICRELDFRSVLLVGHIGKLVKVAGGMMNTHSRFGDCRMEIIAAHAAVCGISSEKAEEILACVTCDDALRILREEHIFEQVLFRLVNCIQTHLKRRIGSQSEIGTVLFSNVYGLLGKSENADSLLTYHESAESRDGIRRL